MTLNLNQPLAWTRALAATGADAADELAMLNDLQGNILKGHGRDFTANLFVAFEPEGQAAARAFVRGIGADVTTALDQLTGALAFKTHGIDAGAFVACVLSAPGYRALGAAAGMPQAAPFVAGMAGRPLNDPDVQQWERHLAEPHAMILLAADSREQRDVLQSQYEARIAKAAGAVRLLGVETGNALRNADGNGIEHFGYVDGRSQPLTLAEDVAEETKLGIAKWQPDIPLSQLLVKCPGGELAVSHGSYFVFRKLEQNVQGFKRRELDLAEFLGGIGERAGASVVGRFENGTPVTLHEDEVPVAAKGAAGVPNDFDYSDDPEGLKCPFAGHIRKTNPRKDTDDSKTHLMARRGIPYGTRTDDLAGDDLDTMPTSGVGLLFMAYQSSLDDQFEFTQQKWVNNAGFRRPQTGIDPVIGQPAHAGLQRYPKTWNQALGEPFDFSGFVTMKGGGYFFAPSISFLRTLGEATAA